MSQPKDAATDLGREPLSELRTASPQLRVRATLQEEHLVFLDSPEVPGTVEGG